MKSLHNPAVHADIRARILALRPDAHRRWGKMSVDQMLWHVNESFRMALGEETYERMPGAPRLPQWFLRWAVIRLPWPKGRSPTYAEWVADGTSHDFLAERSRLLQYIDRLHAKTLDSNWPTNPTLGRMSGMEWSELQAKHVDHHLQQFGA